jgi:dihydrofolate reductase
MKNNLTFNQPGHDPDSRRLTMALTICDMSASLDGYVTGPNDSRENPFGDGAQGLHAWLWPSASDDDRAVLQSAIGSVGAIVMGRKSFEKNEGDGGWGDAGPMGDIPCFVLTHHVPTRPYPSVFSFVSDGVTGAIRQAQQSAGAKDVHLFGATIMQQALPLGLVDEIHLHVMPVLLGGGTALFSHLDSAITLERTGAQITPAATHLQYRVLR